MLFEILMDKLISLTPPENSNKKGVVVAVTIANFCGIIGLLVWGAVTIREFGDPGGWIQIFLAAFMGAIHIGILIYRICRFVRKRRKP